MAEQESYSEDVFKYRGFQVEDGDIEIDPALEVQEQLARLKFVTGLTEFTGKSIIDFGSGTGYSLAWITQKIKTAKVLGLDISENAVKFASEKYKPCEFKTFDLCSPDLNMGLGKWDIVMSYEVFEHLKKPEVFLENLKKHVKPDGIIFLSTPNKDEFSLGYEPSPADPTHLHEYTYKEFIEILNRHFNNVKVFGQRFKNVELKRKSEKLLKRNIFDYKILRGLYWTKFRYIWQNLRGEKLFRFLDGGKLQYTFSDFEFVSAPEKNLDWFLAVINP